MALQWSRNGAAMELQWRCNGVAMALQWSRNGAAMESQWRGNGVAMALQWSRNGAAMESQWRCNGVAMALNVKDNHFHFICSISFYGIEGGVGEDSQPKLNLNLVLLTYTIEETAVRISHFEYVYFSSSLNSFLLFPLM